MQLQEYAATVEEETLLNERKRLACEIHDTLVHIFTNLVIILKVTKFMVNSDQKEIYEHLERARVQANEGLTEIHHVLQALHPVQLNGVTDYQPFNI